MSLRQRVTQIATIHTISDDSDQPTPGSASSPRAESRRGHAIRLNRVLGRIVPLILLVYISYTYDLVVIRYAFRHLYIQQRRVLFPILWLLPTHGLFLFSLRTYLRVFLAHSNVLNSQKGNGGALSWLCRSLGATFLEPSQAQLEEELSIHRALSSLAPAHARVSIHLCQPNGELFRCFRDSCNGRMKAFRTRHCGDCGVCRVGFDHHCAWFDNDVTAPATLSSFVGFLLSIPPLYTLGLGPLFPTAWRTLKRISNFAKSDLEIRSRWWNKWYSWVGGPAFRWILGFGLGTKKWSDMTKAERLPHESVRAPILVALGAVFVFVAIGLAASSLTNLKSGRLTIDVERSKAYWKLEQQMEKLQKTTSGRDHERSAALQRKMDSLAPAQHFRVTWKDNRSGEEKEKIVVLSIQEGLLSHGTPWVNIQRFLGSGNPSGSAPRPAWSLSDSALRKVLQKASIMLPDLDH